MTVSALVFDFDGLILETEGVRYDAWREVFAEYGVPLTIEELAADIGTTGVIRPLEMLEERLGRTLAEREEVRARKSTRERELLLAEEVLPGVVDLLQEAHEAGMGTAVASSSPRSWVAGHLERLGLIDGFAGLATVDDVGVAKPDPAVYRHACELLGVPPAECVAFEDSLHGVRAAHAAGLRCVAVPTDMTRHMALDEADLVVESLAHLTLATLLDRLGDEAGPPGRRG